MNCRKCGEIIETQEDFCPSCGEKLNEDAEMNGNSTGEKSAPMGANQRRQLTHVKNKEKGFLQNGINNSSSQEEEDNEAAELMDYDEQFMGDDYYNPVDPAYYPVNNGRGTGFVAVCAVLGVVSAALIGLLVYMLLTMFGSNPSTIDAEGKLKLSVDNYATETESATVTLEGNISSEINSASLSINGAFVEEVQGGNTKKKWQKDIDLKNGENKFILTLSDGKGNSETKTVVIEHTPELEYAKGTVMKKGDPAAVYVRPGPSSDGELYVMLISENDYSSEFVCVGEEETNSKGELWIRVKTPNKGLGWIRSDLITVK